MPSGSVSFSLVVPGGMTGGSVLGSSPDEPDVSPEPDDPVSPAPEDYSVSPADVAVSVTKFASDMTSRPRLSRDSTR